MPYQSLLSCSLVNRRWYVLANDQSLWKKLCAEQGWEWRTIPRLHGITKSQQGVYVESSDDEGMGDEEDAEDPIITVFGGSTHSPEAYTSASVFAHTESTPMEQDERGARHSTSHLLSSSLKPDYKLLHQTYTRLNNRMRSGSYRLSYLQVRGAPNAHTSTIYCLQLYIYPQTGVQVLFTGSKDRTVREWDLSTGSVVRVISGIHDGSVLSICVHNNLLASAGSDRRIVIWDLTFNKLVKILRDHSDSVLCVRFDDTKLVSCSKGTCHACPCNALTDRRTDKTVRTYMLPHFTPQFVLREHRAAVNAVSISPKNIISASADRSLRLWDAETGALLRIFEDHHGRGYLIILLMCYEALTLSY